MPQVLSAVLEIRETENEQKGNHPRIQGSLWINTLMFGVLHKIPGSPTVRSERTQRRRKMKKQGRHVCSGEENRGRYEWEK